MDDVPQIDPKELEELMSKSDDELLKMFGDYLRQQVIACFNEAMNAAGGDQVTMDDGGRPATDFIPADKLSAVLAVACQLADERKLTVPRDKPMDVTKVFTVNDVLWYILWR